MPGKLVPLTNAANRELARLHGSPEAADLRLRRNQLQPRTREASGRPAGTLTHRVLVLSDLHMGAGRCPITGKFDPGDDFGAKQSRQLINLLANQWAAAATGDTDPTHPTRARVAHALEQMVWASGEKIDPKSVGELGKQEPYALTVCLDGDFVDLLQAVVERPGLPYPDGQASYGGPKNTPANNIVQLNMIRQGHPEIFRALAVNLRLGNRLDVRPGNHDRHLFNPHVWAGEVEVFGKKLGGFLKILEQELSATGASCREVTECLGRVRLLPIAMYGDAFVVHGEETDRHNRVQRPLKELFEPTPLDEEMSLALGDYGVRRAFNRFETLDPTLDSIDDKKTFLKAAARHPRQMAGLASAFLSGLQREGYLDSPGAELEQRLRDARALVDRVPELLEMANEGMPEDRKLSREQIAEGLEAMEKVCATPLFSNFRKGSKLFERLLTIGTNVVFGQYDDRPKREIARSVVQAAHETMGRSVMVHGHDHAPREEAYVTEGEEMLRIFDSHTWTDKVGKNDRWILTWKEDGRGVVVIDRGVRPDGEPFSRIKLQKVMDESGTLVDSDMYADPEPDAAAVTREVRALHERTKKLP